MTQSQTLYHPGAHLNGEYIVQEAILGSTSEVYLCAVPAMGIGMALKTFQPQYLSNPVMWERLRAEALVWHELGEHPHIIPCLGFESFRNGPDRRPFLCMPWYKPVDGRELSLRSWLQSGPLPTRQALKFGIHICRGLAHAQECRPGLVHRDLKPENVLITAGQIAKITDFGLALIGDALAEAFPARLTDHSLPGASATVIGTPAYMAPEQWRKEEVDPRTDIYALGCLLFEMLTGSTPFRIAADDFCEPEEALARWRHVHCTESPASLPSVDNLPHTLNVALAQCLAKSPGERYASAAQLLTDLTAIYRDCYGVDLEVVEEPVMPAAFRELLRGKTYSDLHRYDEALEHLSAAIALGHHHPVLFTQRGKILYQLGRLNEALHDYESALAANKDSAQSWINRGLAHFRMGTFEQAFADYSMAIQLDPSFAEAYNCRGLLYFNRGQYLEALDDVEEALRLNPYFEHAYTTRARIQNEIFEIDQALASCDKALSINATYGPAYVARGDALWRVQRHGEALGWIEFGIQLGETSEEALLLRQSIIGMLDEEQAWLKPRLDVLEREPNHPVALNDAGVTYYRFGKYDEATAFFSQAMEVRPEHAELYYHRGLSFDAMGNADAALADFDRALALAPRDAGLYVTRGKIYNRRGFPLKALADYTAAYDSDPQCGEAYLFAAQILLRLGRLDEAGAYLRIAALRLNPIHRNALTYTRAALERASSADKRPLIAFNNATTRDDINQLVRENSGALEAEFLEQLQAILQTMPADRQAQHKKRLKWLRQAVEYAKQQSASRRVRRK